MCHFVLADSNHAEKCLDVIWFILNYVAFLYKESVCNQFEYLEGHDEVRVWTMQTSSLLQAPKVWTQHLLFWGGKLVDTGFHWALKAKMHFSQNCVICWEAKPIYRGQRAPQPKVCSFSRRTGLDDRDVESKFKRIIRSSSCTVNNLSLSAGGFTPRDSKNEESAYKLSRLRRQVSAAGPERVSSEQRNVIGQITQVWGGWHGAGCLGNESTGYLSVELYGCDVVRVFYSWTLSSYELVWSLITQPEEFARRLTHRSAMQLAALCVCTLPLVLSVCIRAPRLGSVFTLVCETWAWGGARTRIRFSPTFVRLQIHFWPERHQNDFYASCLSLVWAQKCAAFHVTLKVL